MLTKLERIAQIAKERPVKRNLLTVLRSLKYGLKTIEHCLKMN